MATITHEGLLCTSAVFHSETAYSEWKCALDSIITNYTEQCNVDEKSTKHTAFGIVGDVLNDKFPDEILLHILMQSDRSEFIKWLLLSRKLWTYTKSKYFLNAYFTRKLKQIVKISPNGKRIIQVTTLFGKLHGRATFGRYDNINKIGNVFFETNFIHGEENGHIATYYANGSTAWECITCDGKLHGVLQSYFVGEPGKRGNIRTITTFVDGISSGFSIRFNPNGSIEIFSSIECSAKHGITLTFDPGNILKGIQRYKHNKPIEPPQYFQSNGHKVPIVLASTSSIPPMLPATSTICNLM
jgi:antitoxin component YwqK of YwqJK toxin-antitoxin module